MCTTPSLITASHLLVRSVGWLAFCQRVDSETLWRTEASPACGSGRCWQAPSSILSLQRRGQCTQCHGSQTFPFTLPKNKLPNSSISLSVKQLWLALFLTGMLGRLKETVLKKHLAEFLVGVSRQSTLAMSLIH